MAELIVYVDASDVHEGALEELKVAIKELVDFIEANEPRLLAYNVYFSADGTRMTVVQVHTDTASLEYHLEIAGPVFRRFVELVTLSSIHIYGEPSEKVLTQAREKARLLGRGDVVVAAWHAGFTRFTAGR
jgi:quinol monooxygenase YgiN